MSLERSFQTLDNWRKLYIAFVWLATALIFYFVYDSIQTQANEGPVALNGMIMIMYATLPIFACWISYAVIQRATTQITILAIASLIPFLNIINATLLFIVLRLTKKELEASGT